MFEERDENICVCRCEEVTLAEIRQAIAQGADSVRDIKLRTHAGMGVCQGMTCRRNIERILREAGLDPRPCETTQLFPVRLANIDVLSRMAGEELK